MTPIERFKVDEGVNKYGVRKIVHFDGDQIVSQVSGGAMVARSARFPPLCWRKSLPSRASKSARSSS